MDVDASSLAVVNLAAHHGGVGVGLHLKACYAVPMDVTVLKVTLETKMKELLDGSVKRGNRELLTVFLHGVRGDRLPCRDQT